MALGAMWWCWCTAPGPVLHPMSPSRAPQLLHEDEPLPTACDPADVSHGYVPIRVKLGVFTPAPRAKTHIKGSGEGRSTQGCP